jgi:hypothetical protein
MLQVIGNDAVHMKNLALWKHKENCVARYFFDIDDGDVSSRDTVGTECATLQSARHQAVATLTAIAKDTIPKDGDRQQFALSVRDENDVTVYTAALTFSGRWVGDGPL